MQRLEPVLAFVFCGLAAAACSGQVVLGGLSGDGGPLQGDAAAEGGADLDGGAPWFDAKPPEDDAPWQGDAPWQDDAPWQGDAPWQDDAPWTYDAPPAYDAPWEPDGGPYEDAPAPVLDAPWVDPDSSAWLVDAGSIVPPPPIDASTYFGWMQQALVGTWEGARTDPWDPPATVTVRFETSGAYTAHCVSQDPACGVWHYGTDEDLPLKTYKLYNLNADQTGVASIVIAWSPSDTQAGTLQSITIDSSGTHLSFDFEPTWLALTPTPVHFDLQRVGP